MSMMGVLKSLKSSEAFRYNRSSPQRSIQFAGVFLFARWGEFLQSNNQTIKTKRP